MRMIMRNSVIVRSGESDVYKVTEDIVILIVSITHPVLITPGPRRLTAHMLTSANYPDQAPGP